jgi:DNA-binding MarR family transcriptional regulator
MSYQVQSSVQAERPAPASRPSVGVVAWLRLVRVFQKIQHQAAEHLRSFGLNVAQFDVLARVGAAEGIMQQEVADSLVVTKSNVCQLLDRMEQAGLVERRPEGRANRLYLTPNGRQLWNQVVPAHEQLIAEQLSALSPTEQVQLLGLLRTVDRALG